jgi:hypothetical protein
VMPVSFEHEFLVDLFRKRAELAVALLRTCANIEVDYAHVAHDSIDLSQVAPTGYFADTVVVLQDRTARPVTGVIIEVQRDVDDTKLLTWPSYVANLRAKRACDALLLVIAPDPAVAAWARQPIELGHPGFRLTPIVVGFDDVPEIHDRFAASQLPQLAVLSAMAHPRLEIAEVAIEAVAQLPAELARLYYDVIIDALPATVRQVLEARMQRYEYKSDFARKYYGQGLQEGRQEGLQEGRQEGLQEGLQEAAIAVARSKVKGLSDDDVAAIGRISDQIAMTDLITALGRARSKSAARAALDKAIAEAS